jgi:hypothetical protein
MSTDCTLVNCGELLKPTPTAVLKVTSGCSRQGNACWMVKVERMGLEIALREMPEWTIRSQAVLLVVWKHTEGRQKVQRL